MGISSPGIGSNIDVNGIVAKLMAVEAAPLTTLDKKAASYQAKITALGAISGAIGGFQSSLSSLSSASSFQSVQATSNDTNIMVGAATNKAAAGIYSVNVTQLAQAQTLASGGYASTTAAIGDGTSTTVSFQLGTVSGGSFGLSGGALGAGVLSGGISNGALSINGTAITTDAGTRSAKLLADAINAKNATSGVSATALPTSTSAALFAGFGAVDTSAGGSYALSVAGIELASQAPGLAAGTGVSALTLDTLLAGSNGVTDALAAANITHTGSAANGNLQFIAADGSNLTVSETASGAVNGGIGKASSVPNSGSSVTASSTVTLSSASASPITVAGTNPALAGLAAGTGGAYLGAGFTQDANQVSGTVVIDSSNNSLQGIRDAINKANLGVTATVVSDGSAAPNHLVLTSTKTGASSTIKISLAATGGGAPDPALDSLLGYDPAGVQHLNQNTAAQSTTLNVNGIPITSATNTVSGAIQGVTLTIGAIGKANLNVAQDTNAVKNGVNAFVKAYNDLNKAIKDSSGYDATTKSGGALLGDATVQTLQNQLRKQLSTGITGLSGNLTTLSQVGIAFQKDGSISLDASKLGKAITSNFSDIAGLFAAVGNASDSLVSFSSSTAATKPGDYPLSVSRLATQGSLTSENALGASTVIAADTTWSVTLNQTDPVTSNRTATVALAAGTYTPAQLATLVQSAINGAGSLAANDLAVTASIDAAGKLNVVSAKYGSTSKIAISGSSGTAPIDIFGSASALDGLDIAGTLGGQPATGSGQILTGGDGLKVEVTGGAIGNRGTVGFSQGYAYQLNNLAATYLGSAGFIAGRTSGMDATLKDIDKQKTVFSDRLVQIEKRYRAQYTALDTSISSLTATSSFLTQQFAALTKSSA